MTKVHCIVGFKGHVGSAGINQPSIRNALQPPNVANADDTCAYDAYRCSSLLVFLSLTFSYFHK